MNYSRKRDPEKESFEEYRKRLKDLQEHLKHRLKYGRVFWNSKYQGTYVRGN